MSEPGQESQSDRYVRIKAQPQLFDWEMQSKNLSSNIIEAMHEYCDDYYGCAPLQEQMMTILMDERVAHFDLKEADSARKVIAKKKMDQIPKLRDLVFSKIGNENDATYVWDTVIRPQLGYAFSINHSLPYSFVGIQTIIIATQFNPIYWNTACLIVNSGSTEIGAGSTDYTKVAKAIGLIRDKDIKVSLIDINKSDFSFKPDAEQNQILYALKALVNVGDDLIQDIINNRPYVSMIDFINKVSPNKQAMIALIKAGAFDQFVLRQEAMVQYIWLTCDKKSRLTLQNLPGLIRNNLLPQDTEEQRIARSVYEFNRYLKDRCKNPADIENYYLDTRAIDFLIKIEQEQLIVENKLNIKIWDKKVYQPWMDIFRNWINADKETILDNLNTAIFMKDWEKYCGRGNISAWEMEALCFYYHEHELAHINMTKYGLVNFNGLPEEPIVDKYFNRGQAKIPIYKLHSICGTCIAKNKNKSIVYLLTTSGVVTVKMTKEYFSKFDSQISRRNPDGTKTIMEKSFFNRGNMIIVKGIRRGEEFVLKNYKSSSGHSLYHIDKVHKDGALELRHERYNGEEENDNE